MRTALLLIAILTLGCRQSTNSNNIELTELPTTVVTNRNPYEYVKHPDKNDSICLRDIKNAINDSAKGIIKFCIPIGSGSSPKRCEKQLRTLCKQYGMQIEPIFISDEIVEGQTQGCYCVYMDNLIAQKFGPSFKTYLINTADSLLANSNDTINGYSCDTRPNFIGGTHDIGFEIVPNKKIVNKLKCDSIGDEPFMDIDFYIDTNGIASGFNLNFFNDLDIVENTRMQSELYNEAILNLKKTKRWQSGTIKGKKVFASTSARIFFRASKSKFAK